MFGLIIKGLVGIGVPLCFSVVRAVFDVDLLLSDDSNVQIPIRDLAECTAKKVMDVSIDSWMSSYKVETLPSGLTNRENCNCRYYGE